LIDEINVKNSESDFLTGEEALALLGVKPATLYSYVSRGLIRRIQSAGTRRSRYARADIEKLHARRRGAMSKIGAAGDAMRWGEPVVGTCITAITAQGPVYRKRAAIDLANSGASFEAVVHLLMTGIWPEEVEGWTVITTPASVLHQLRRPVNLPGSADFGRLLASTVLALGMEGRGTSELSGGSTTQSARLILQTLAGAFGLLSPARKFVARREGETIAALVLRASGSPATGAAQLNSALVMLADHELASATFVARVAASTQADLFNCVAAAICAHSGSATGVATDHAFEKLLKAATGRNADALVALVRERGATAFGFNHPMYARGDPRADHLIRMAEAVRPVDLQARRFLSLIGRCREELDTHPGVAVALTALVRALGMPPASAGALWILSRSAGWMAHALEQRTQAYMLRPRARYMSS